ncbi:MAG TPA: U32 family peptidase [Pseudolabrys sp.]|nr:U32 family peptidase [Pseudolabrys sp.]
MVELAAGVTLGPVLFNWQPEKWRDFYFRIADEAPVSTVYLGETVCSKRAPLPEPYFDAVVKRLISGKKTVVYSTLSEVVNRIDRRLVEQICGIEDFLVEVNDASALPRLQGRPHHIGPLMNVYNERTAAFLGRKGAKNICLPVEMPATAVATLCQSLLALDTTVEVQVFGRQSLALSARCYHARAHGRTKDTCRFVCENDPDGLELTTLDNRPFLAINGVQTLSYEYLNLIAEIPALRAMGVSRFRLSSHTLDMVRIGSIFCDTIDGRIDTDEAAARLEAIRPDAPFSNGFYHGKPGFTWNKISGPGEIRAP